jgi:hypothetical protein
LLGGLLHPTREGRDGEHRSKKNCQSTIRRHMLKQDSDWDEDKKPVDCHGDDS